MTGSGGQKIRRRPCLLRPASSSEMGTDGFYEGGSLLYDLFVILNYILISLPPIRSSPPTSENRTTVEGCKVLPTS